MQIVKSSERAICKYFKFQPLLKCSESYKIYKIADMEQAIDEKYVQRQNKFYSPQSFNGLF